MEYFRPPASAHQRTAAIWRPLRTRWEVPDPRAAVAAGTGSGRRAAGAAQRNQRCVARLRTDDQEDALWQAVIDDVKQGRMDAPVPVSSLDLHNVLLTPRFSVVQGPKVRPVDDATASGLNACTRCDEKMSHDVIDRLVEAARVEHAARGQQPPHFWKADVDAAFRRVPLDPRAAHLAHVIFLRHGEPVSARHRAVFFGATSSVHNWERVGALLAAILRRVVHIPALRYVDDFFGAEAADLAQHTKECALPYRTRRGQCVLPRRRFARARRCVARVIRCLLGTDSMKDKKMECGNPLVILGLRVEARGDATPTSAQ